ncbi:MULTISPECIES: hypothetical protein [unclassified Microcoleus]|uniref:hypothetical protein n=1 Tax=unclassified Microcoleus TaxID=2642155 RepID=UPI002FCE8D8D
MISHRPHKSQKTRQIPLRLLLIIPFVLQIVGAVGLVGYLSYRSGQKAVEDIANQLMDRATNRVRDRLYISIEIQQQAVALNHRAVQQGSLNLKDFEQLRNHFWQQILYASLSVNNYFFANEKGEGIGYHRIFSQETIEQTKKLTGENLEIGTILFSEVRPEKLTQRNYYLVDNQGIAKKLIYPLAVDIRRTDWYRAAKAAKKQTCRRFMFIGLYQHWA